MIRRLVTTSVAAVALFAAPAAIGALTLGAAAAAPAPTPSASYPVTSEPGTVTKAVIYTGNTVGFSGGGFLPFTSITITADITAGGVGFAAPIPAGVVANLTASASGTFSFVITLTVVGHTTLVATGMGTDGRVHTATSLVTVLPLGGAVIPTATPTSGSKPTSTGKATSGSNPKPSATASSGAAVGPTVQASGGSNNAGGNSSGTLPKTGADNVGIELWMGGALLLAGGAVVFVSVTRRRSARTT